MTLASIGLLSLEACAPHTYAPGPGMSAETFGPDSANCRLFARGTRPNTSFSAYGSSQDVAIATGAAMLIGGIGTAVHDDETFDDCMQARGWRVVGVPASEPVALQPATANTSVQQQPAPFEAPVASSSSIPAPAFGADNEKADRARMAAEAWLIAQRILNEPDPSGQQRGLYTVLCHTGDQSSCIMAQALAQASN